MYSVRLADLPPDFRARALRWAAAFPYCAYFEPNTIQYPQGAFNQRLAVRHRPAYSPGSLAELEQWLGQSSQAPRCGILTYDLKNEVEALHSHNPDNLNWPTLHFFEPEIWLDWLETTLTIHTTAAGSLPASEVLEQILAARPLAPAQETAPSFQARLPKPEYLAAVEAIREDILNGEVYELNLCQEFFAENVVLEPVEVFLRLLKTSPTPFAAFYRWHDHYLLCASPERFLRRQGTTLLSQPIKGTIRRGSTPATDEQQRQTLLHDEKERAENLMIVDLVRNDLARVAETGTVHVPELFGLYPFRHVWQMISTVQATAQPGLGLVDALRATFPMGSMTGAPKIRAMQLIEHYERSRRGLYSGSIGYVLPNGDFDFNVVIRSLQYRQDTGYLSFQVGSAITYDSVPEHEYQECLLKAQGLLEVLGADIA
ncbi:anthranilate synthase component I family protein [Hymenobacter taeanensis]|uniref:Anthranilate synthase component I family protein n=1 Tax=Hymenobacter taeanensis TaxID=2735321 RepID=A0A6M6BLC2_9BACT|nr:MULTISPECIES: anthranilate synthase component I family protein [Hymenobacter]QJX48792.1 anthranilate synthase component I family protein [Hymenobacter taeanensis]UOQ81702.1 anthranilate synthase component I family protein [Hymenobacter sp. 5414T-23]